MGNARRRPRAATAMRSGRGRVPSRPRAAPLARRPDPRPARRPPQDVLVVTAPGSGAEVIPFLKTWVNLPMAVGFAVLYAKLADILSNEALFYTCIIPFIVFFGSFAFVLYPARDLIHPTALCERLAASAPRLAAPIAILRNWTYCLFYVMAELWGSVVVSVLFWGFANQARRLVRGRGAAPCFFTSPPGRSPVPPFSGHHRRRGQAVLPPVRPGRQRGTHLLRARGQGRRQGGAGAGAGAGAGVGGSPTHPPFRSQYFSAVRAALPPGVDGWGVSLKGMMGEPGGERVSGAAAFGRARGANPPKKSSRPFPVQASS